MPVGIERPQQSAALEQALGAAPWPQADGQRANDSMHPDLLPGGERKHHPSLLAYWAHCCCAAAMAVHFGSQWASMRLQQQYYCAAGVINSMRMRRT